MPKKQTHPKQTNHDQEAPMPKKPTTPRPSKQANHDQEAPTPKKTTTSRPSKQTNHDQEAPMPKKPTTPRPPKQPNRDQIKLDQEAFLNGWVCGVYAVFPTGANYRLNRSKTFYYYLNIDNPNFVPPIDL